MGLQLEPHFWRDELQALSPLSPFFCTKFRTKSATLPFSSNLAANERRYVQSKLCAYVAMITSLLCKGHSPPIDYGRRCFVWLRCFSARRGNRRGGHCLDPSLHCRRLHLHRHRVRDPRVVGEQQVQTNDHGNPCSPCWRVHDGPHCSVRVSAILTCACYLALPVCWVMNVYVMEDFWFNYNQFTSFSRLVGR